LVERCHRFGRDPEDGRAGYSETLIMIEYPEEEVSRLLLNVGTYLPKYTASRTAIVFSFIMSDKRQQKGVLALISKDMFRTRVAGVSERDISFMA
jgi:hypothetical protein